MIFVFLLDINDHARVAQDLRFHGQILHPDFLYICGKSGTYTVRVEEQLVVLVDH